MLTAFFNAGFGCVDTNTTQMKAIFYALNDPDEEQKERLSQAYQPQGQLLREVLIPNGIANGDFGSV